MVGVDDWGVGFTSAVMPRRRTRLGEVGSCRAEEVEALREERDEVCQAVGHDVGGRAVGEPETEARHESAFSAGSREEFDGHMPGEFAEAAGHPDRQGWRACRGSDSGRAAVGAHTVLVAPRTGAVAVAVIAVGLT